MTPEQIERVFGRGRLQMATGAHVEVFREAVAPGERRRYTKRFLSTGEGDFGQWTEREWRILARLIGHGIACVPEVVQFDRGRLDGVHMVQTYDAGVTVDQWATLLPVKRDGRIYRHVFEDCAHWWALAYHCLQALHVIHPLELVHLDVKGDNVCIPYAPTGFDPDSPDLRLQPIFAQLALIDFAFALISRERLTTPLPIGWQRDYDYQSPRLLAALEAGRGGELRLTRELDWRCDMYSLAAMLKRYLPEDRVALQPQDAASWTAERYEAAKALILRIRDCHDRDLPAEPPHAALIALCAERLQESELALSLQRGWTLAREATVSASASPLTPVTRLAPAARMSAIPVTRSGRRTAVTVVPGTANVVAGSAPGAVRRATRLVAAFALLFIVGAAAAALWMMGERSLPSEADLRALAEPVRKAASRLAEAAPELPWLTPSPQVQGERKGLRGGEGAAAPRNGSDARVVAAPPALPSASDVSRAEAPAGVAGAPPAVSAPQPASAAPMQDSSAVSRPAQRTTARPATTANAPSSSKVASAPPRATAKPPRTASKTTSATHLAKNQPAPQPRKAHAWWASLEPPAWLHGSGPGEPPGATAREGRAAATASAPTKAELTPSKLAISSRAIEAQAPAAQSAPPARAEAASPPASPAPAQVAAAPAPRAESSLATPQVVPSATVPGAPPPTAEAAADELATQARRTLADAVPRVAKRAEPEVARVLWMGADAYSLIQQRPVTEAARLIQVTSDPVLLARTTAPAEARRLSDQARVLASKQSFPEAFNTALRAFGANPRDPDIAGSLALLHLKLAPRDASTARQMALFAIATRASQFHSARTDDWYTLAVSSALDGRETDAINAMYVTLALSGDAGRSCSAGLHALATYGERLLKPVEALFYRVQAQGRGQDVPACAWPPNWSAVSRLP
jgi:hypothetical protein